MIPLSEADVVIKPTSRTNARNHFGFLYSNKLQPQNREQLMGKARSTEFTGPSREVVNRRPSDGDDTIAYQSITYLIPYMHYDEE